MCSPGNILDTPCLRIKDSNQKDIRILLSVGRRQGKEGRLEGPLMDGPGNFCVSKHEEQSQLNFKKKLFKGQTSWDGFHSEEAGPKAGGRELISENV